MLNQEQLLKLIRDKVDHPSTPRELLQRLKIPREQRATFKRLLGELVSGGHLVQTRGNRYGLPDRMNLVVGRITTNPRGFGFVVPDRPLEEVDGDIYVAGSNLNQAMHGDRVVARIERITDRGAEGRIVRILERGSSNTVGRFDIDESGWGFVVPFDRRLIMDVQIPSGESKDARPGDMVTVEITKWPTAARGPLGRVVEVLGGIDEPGVDTEIILRKYGIVAGHGEDAVEEARRLGAAVKERDLKDRTDFRSQVTVTIDGEHARDFDDAITLDRLENGNYWLGVHIADVAHYVPEGGALDEEGYERATSVYFPERAVHMFPSELATGLCSLNPNVDRLVQTCLMEIDRKGTVVRYELHDGVIHSNARMTYTEVNAILTDRDPEVIAKYPELVPLFERMHELFEILNRRRHRRGSIDFDLKEPEIVLDDEGMVEAIIALERNVAHRIIEEFMLVANETVAQHLDDHDVPSLFRIHEDPDPLKVDEFEEFVTTLGYSLGAPPDAVKPRHFQKLVEKMRGTPEEKPIAFLMLRTMQKARYDPQNLGHFGLAAKSYTHFTSPIRRYPDLVVHRTLRESRHGLIDQERREQLEEDLPEMARHTSERERRAADAERELVQWKKVRFMADKVGDEFEGYITGVTAFGLFIELVQHFVEGLVHISTMADDYYRFVERVHILRGENTGKEYRLGDKVAVQVIKVDMERRQVDLGLVEILEAVRESERNRGPRRSSAEPRRPAAAPGRGWSVAPVKADKKKDKTDKSVKRKQRPVAASAPCGKAVKTMRNVLGEDVELEDAYLDRMRETIDAPADAVATTLIERGAAGLVKDLMRQRKMWEADGEPSRLLPEDIRAYMKTASALPPWCDRAKIAEAQQFFLLYGLASSTLLACASLPQCYVMKYGTEVLAYTKFLQVEPTRRVRETAQMVMDVMVPGGLQPGGRGVRATMRVRVMHAIVRHMVMNDPRAVANPSDPELRAKFGLPINQEDMVYTLMTFSYVVIEGFRSMGYDMTEAQRDGYVHCWNVVGSLMGIREDLLPARFDDAAELFKAIQRRQRGQSEAGVKLTRALIDAVEDALPGDHHDPLIAVLTRRLVGDATADALEIPRPTLVQKLRLDAMLEAWEVSARVAARLHADRPFRFASEALHHAIMVKMGGMGGAAFEVPPEFIARWFPDGPPGQ